MSTRVLLSAFFFGLVATASTCLWDRDTLAQEARGKTTLLNTIVGRFERNPPLYYEIRLARVAKELKDTPERLDLYDDAAVSADRLGRHDEAVRWIERKRSHLGVLDPKQQESRDHWYRYYANAGTFWAHRWIAAGAKKERLEEMKRARDLIARAIEVNPNAHFGREEYQLHAIHWLIAQRQKKDVESFATYLDEKRLFDRLVAERTEKGLVGLVRLGNGARSLDLHIALANVLAPSRDASMARLALFRAQELEASGVKSLDLTWTKAEEMFQAFGEPLNNENLPTLFKGLRQNADAWHLNRETFMLRQLKAGKHPDTHPNFWQGYEEVPPYQLPERSWWSQLMVDASQSAAVIFGVIAAVCLGLIALLVAIGAGIRHRIRRRQQRVRVPFLDFSKEREPEEPQEPALY